MGGRFRVNRFFNNEKGLTLVELLVAVSIGSLLLVLIPTIHLFIQNQYNDQSTDVKQLTDLTLAMKSITKDIRSANVVEDSENHKQLTLTDDHKTTTYVFEDNMLKKNNLPFVHELEHFEVKKDAAKITITIKQQSGREVRTEIVRRGE